MMPGGGKGYVMRIFLGEVAEMNSHLGVGLLADISVIGIEKVGVVMRGREHHQKL